MARGRVLWAQAQLDEVEANAYRIAAAAAREIGETDISNRWASLANDKQSASVHGFAAAKASGYYGETDG
jgi:hypothetical protein